MRQNDALRRRILELCAEHDMSVNALSLHCGIRQSTLNNIISGRNHSTTIHTVARICRGLEITLPEFFDSDYFRVKEQDLD